MPCPSLLSLPPLADDEVYELLRHGDASPASPSALLMIPNASGMAGNFFFREANSEQARFYFYYYR